MESHKTTEKTIDQASSEPLENKKQSKKIFSFFSSDNDKTEVLLRPEKNKNKIFNIRMPSFNFGRKKEEEKEYQLFEEKAHSHLRPHPNPNPLPLKSR